MKEIKNKKLAFSCPLSKDKLNKKGNDFHCDQCNHTVIDFTNKSEEQLQETLDKTKGRVCGIFKKRQLSPQFLKYAAASVLMSSSIAFRSQAQENIKTDSTYQACDSVADDDITFGMVVGEMAKPIGGYEKLYQAIEKELNLPDELHSSGKVYMQFTVDTTGSMKEIAVVKGYDKKASTEALRVMKKIDYPFITASQRGKKIKSRLVIPINFNVEGED